MILEVQLEESKIPKNCESCKQFNSHHLGDKFRLEPAKCLLDGHELTDAVMHGIVDIKCKLHIHGEKDNLGIMMLKRGINDIIVERKKLLEVCNNKGDITSDEIQRLIYLKHRQETYESLLQRKEDF